MFLSELIKNIVPLKVERDIDILGLSLDSRAIQPGYLFLAIKGAAADGRVFIPQAIAQGAAAVLVETDSIREAYTEYNLPILPVQGLRQLIAPIAARFYGYPAEKLRLLGVTGTNGKTSCTHFFAQCLEALDISCGIMGTLGAGFYKRLGAAGLTTPDAVNLQANLHQFVLQDAEAVAMEVSSHSIDQGRVNDVPFDIGIFTNLTQDHLDYHGDMATYASVKHRFLAEWPIKHLIINADDAYGKRWLTEFNKDRSLWAYSVQPQRNTSSTPIAFIEKAHFTLEGITGYLNTPWGEGELCLPLIGQFNLSNVMAILSALCLYGIPFNQALTQLSRLKPVEGRMQSIRGENQPLIVVDYAHTPDALDKVLQALRVHTGGKLYCVFGCGGERDHSKRPLMAKIAEAWADKIIVTNDNPRHENPEEIANQILQGFTARDRVTVMLDRSKAIQNSIQWAEAGDCVLIAGKGAERYQQIGDQKIPFDDVEQVRRCLMHLVE